jgi:hypothetical protein
LTPEDIEKEQRHAKLILTQIQQIQREANIIVHNFFLLFLIVEKYIIIIIRVEG